jgi:hypothetical protein
VSDLEQLLKRVRAAKGADREIDGALFDALCIDKSVSAEHMAKRAVANDREHGTQWAAGIKWLPRFTDSLDAITALVERELPGMTGIIPLTSDGEAWLWPRGGNPKGWRCRANTPALALCAAFCRAMASTAGNAPA